MCIRDSTKGAYTNKAPGGVAYRCSFRVTEASFLIERLVQNAAYEIGMDPAEFHFDSFSVRNASPLSSNDLADKIARKDV